MCYLTLHKVDLQVGELPAEKTKFILRQQEQAIADCKSVELISSLKYLGSFIN